MDGGKANRVKRRRGRPPRARLRTRVRLTLGFDEDADVIEAFLETPRGYRATLVREALRYYVRSGKLGEFRQKHDRKRFSGAPENEIFL